MCFYETDTILSKVDLTCKNSQYKICTNPKMGIALLPKHPLQNEQNYFIKSCRFKTKLVTDISNTTRDMYWKTEEVARVRRLGTKCAKGLEGNPPPPPQVWTDTQTHVKTLPFRRTTYEGGNEWESSSWCNCNVATLRCGGLFCYARV